MPLIILTGFPCSGKSRLAEDLKQYFKDKNKDVVLVSEKDYLTNSYSDYSSSAVEKTIRAGVKAAVIRAISKTTLVILDAPNYIKGYRYELFCVAKQHSTPHCLVQPIVSAEQAWHWNTQRQHQYPKDTFNELVFRYEAPDDRNRWDSPLISVVWDGDLNYQAVEEALYSGKTVKPHQATQLQPLSANNFIHTLDKATQEVVSAIISAQQTQAVGDVRVEGCDKSVTIGRKVTLPELSRARKQFIIYTKSHPIYDHKELITSFVVYLNSTLQ